MEVKFLSKFPSACSFCSWGDSTLVKQRSFAVELYRQFIE
eukprot:SAG31_NODE_17738_length_659_cov_1.280357_1_plen_39_part_10